MKYKVVVVCIYNILYYCILYFSILFTTIRVSLYNRINIVKEILIIESFKLPILLLLFVSLAKFL